jgi:hypothetical protein
LEGARALALATNVPCPLRDLILPPCDLRAVVQGFFGPRVPVDNLDAGTIGVNYFLNKQLVNPMVISPDAGGVYRAKKFLEE